MTSWVDASAVPGYLNPGMRVYVGGSSNEPGGLLDAIAAQPASAAGVTFVQFPLAGLNNRDLSAVHPDARLECFFMAPQLADGLAQGRVAFLPMQMRAVFDFVASQAFDVALLQVAYDREGKLRLGPNVDFAAAAMSSARALIAEVNEAIVAPAGCPLVDPDRFDALVRTRRPLTPFGGGAPDATAHRIAEHVAALVRDGDCIQTGIGAIPAAILAALANKNDLGMHSGLIDDGGMALIERGVMTRQRETHRPRLARHRHGAWIRGIARLVGESPRRRVSRRRSHARSRRDPATFRISCRSTRPSRSICWAR